MAESHRDEIAKLEALYANNPEGRVFTHLAEAYRKAGELDRARRIVEQGLERHPDYSSAHVVLGRVLMDQGEDAASARAFERVLELDRHNLVALKSLGDVLHRVGRPGEALERYRDLLMVDPGDDRVRMTVARLEQEVLDADAGVGEAAEAAEADHESGAEAASGPMGPEEPSPEPAVAGSAVPAEPRSEADAGDIGEAAPDADEAATQPPREQLQQQAIESAQDAGSESTPAASEPDAPSEAPQSGEQRRGRDPWEERFAPPQPALPGDLAALAAEGGAPAPESTDREPVEFYDFRASSLTEFGWARERSSQREPALDAAPSEATGEQPEVAPSEMESAYDGDDAEPDEQVAADESSTDEAIDAGGDSTETAAGPSTEAVAGGEAHEAGEWLAPEAWARLSTSQEHMAAASGPPGQGASDDDRAEDEVLTETMAELYEAQGFHHRAAEIYHELLRRQPGDERLLARLSQAESAARQRRDATSSEERTPNVPASEQAYFEAQQSETESGEQERDDAWAEDVESVWTGGAGVAGAVPTPYAWTDQETGEEAGTRRPIREFFNELLSWRPSGSVAVAAEPAHETATEAVDVEAELTLTEDAIVEATAEPGGAVPSDAGDQSGWFERAGEGGPTSGEEDEDLEMFRSWLQSLKK